MKRLVILTGLAGTLFIACNSAPSEEQQVEKLRDEAIAIHDEIMPQVSTFDRNTVKIDSILTNLGNIYAERPDIDTAETRSSLTSLKYNLESATSDMMTWMMEFEPDIDIEDSSEEASAYYQEEVDKVTALKKRFEEVKKESEAKLSSF